MAGNLDNYKPRKTSRGFPWIKTHTDLIDEPEYMQLTDQAKAVYFEVYILAGRSDAGGLVSASNKPATIDKIAWLLRRSANDLRTVIDELVQAGLLELQGDQVTVCRFASEQGPEGRAADKRAVWAKNQRDRRDALSGKAKPESETEPEPEKDTEGEKNQESEPDQELKNQTQTKSPQVDSYKTQIGVRYDNEFDGNFDKFAGLILDSWKVKTGKTYKPGQVFYDMVQDWINAGVQIKHVLGAIQQTSGKADTPIYLRDIAVKIKDNDPQMVATKRLDKFKEMAKDLQDGD